ncbi:MAG: hypothetical protein K2H38_12785 [Muribaculaceae bacterium]|nr:hypothetical protein [Muribaculaceae bacterium]
MPYYKIPPTYVEMFGLANIMKRFPDGNYFVPRAVLARINPDIDKALEMCGGIAITLDEARDEQLGLAFHPLPGDSADKDADTDLSMPQEGAPA